MESALLLIGIAGGLLTLLSAGIAAWLFGRRARRLGRRRGKWMLIGTAVYFFAALLFSIAAEFGHLSGNHLPSMASVAIVGLAGHVFGVAIAYLMAPWMLRSPTAPAVQPPRDRALTLLLPLFGLTVVLGTAGNLFFARPLAAQLRTAPYWVVEGLNLAGLTGVLMLIGLVALWRRRRWGLWLFGAGGLAIAVLHGLLVGPVVAAVGAAGVLLILWLTNRQAPNSGA